jgi:hypothetical protein
MATPEVPAQIGPVEFGAFGGWITVRCPKDLDPLMSQAGGLWDPASRRWLIVPRRIGPVIHELERQRTAPAHGTAARTWKLMTR